MALIKGNHTYCTATSSFPCTTLNDLTTWAKQCCIFGPDMPQANFDRQFIAANVTIGNDGSKDNNATSLVRYEFIEFLIRIADQKYKGRTETVSAALKLLVDECIFPHSQHGKWQQWREEFLWTIDVNDVLEANIDNLFKIYNSWIYSIKNIKQNSK